MLPSDRFAFEDMLESSEILVSYAVGLTFERFAEQRMPFDAIVRRLTVVGEAARQVSESTQMTYSDID